MADSGQGEVSLRKRGNLTVPTYSSIGERSAEEKIKIALAPKNPSQTDLNIVEEAKKQKPRKKLFGIF